MYTGLLKDTLLKMDFTSEHIQKMVQAFLQHYKDDYNEQPIINEFAKNYRAEKVIWWYTRECFVYNEVNGALRDLDGDIIINMGFFIHDLHKQIEQLYEQQLSSFGTNKFIHRSLREIQEIKRRSSRFQLLLVHQYRRQHFN